MGQQLTVKTVDIYIFMTDFCKLFLKPITRPEYVLLSFMLSKIKSLYSITCSHVSLLRYCLQTSLCMF